ncbi:hypothetical protein OIU84_010087 [Salix udensis]|uniref:Uncharacterized protein n=1 Tax=Salix udensis TaxID=889485 RepID=A0AAD6NVH4_9ROSI|nr:hypothetical protein OIU84_010087 [Salix udensis]
MCGEQKRSSLSNQRNKQRELIQVVAEFLSRLVNRSFVESTYHKAIHRCIAISPDLEGSAHGGCISRAKFKIPSNIAIMECFFAITNAEGAGIGTAIASFYNPHSPGALAAEAGILVFMALADLTAADFSAVRGCAAILNSDQYR